MKYYISLIAVLSTVIYYQITHLPTKAEYYYNADEGTYFYQAQHITQNGLSGFKTLSQEYLTNTYLQKKPHPLRVFHTLTNTVFLSFNNSIEALAYNSLFFYFLSVILIFWFIKARFGLIEGFLSGIFVATSPIFCAMARRALMDSEQYFFHLLILVLLLEYLYQPQSKKAILLGLSIGLGLLSKESIILLVPFVFFTLVIYEARKWQNICLIFGTACAFFVGSLFLLVGFESSINIYKSLLSIPPIPYVEQYGAAPWYCYLIDLIVLSPIITLCSFISISLVFSSSSYNPFQKKIIQVLLIFLVSTFLIYSPIPKDIRFTGFIDAILRIFVALAIILIYNKSQINTIYKNIILFVCVIGMLFSDYKNFYKIFIDYKIYDPVSYNLLAVNGFIPDAYNNHYRAIDKPANPEVVALLHKSCLALSKNDSFTCLKLCREILMIDVDNAKAYNNLGVGYYQQGNIDEAINMFKTAIRTDPKLKIAVQNLEIVNKKSGR